ncbi:hypothetical protein M2266_000974 [Streptomyces sp. SPB162]|nr:hypothetical protein [Streptomyces sp. SPB162]
MEAEGLECSQRTVSVLTGDALLARPSERRAAGAPSNSMRGQQGRPRHRAEAAAVASGSAVPGMQMTAQWVLKSKSSWSAVGPPSWWPRARRDTRHRPRRANREVASVSRAESRVQPRMLSTMKWSWPPVVSLVGARQPPGSNRGRSGTGCTAFVPAPPPPPGRSRTCFPVLRVAFARPGDVDLRRWPFPRARPRPRPRPLAGQRAAGRAGVRSRVSESRRGVYAPSASGTARGRCSARERSAGAGCRSRRRSVRGRLP